jgi:hypothetical protein
MKQSSVRANQSGFIPMLIALLIVLIGVIVFAYLRVAHR